MLEGVINPIGLHLGTEVEGSKHPLAKFVPQAIPCKNTRLKFGVDVNPEPNYQYIKKVHVLVNQCIAVSNCLN